MCSITDEEKTEQLIIRLTSLCPRCLNCPRRDKSPRRSEADRSATHSGSPGTSPPGIALSIPHHKRPLLHGQSGNVKARCHCTTMVWGREASFSVFFQISEPSCPNATTHGYCIPGIAHRPKRAISADVSAEASVHW